MLPIRLSHTLVLLLLLAMSGCVTGRREIALAPPTLPAAATATDRGEIVIVEVTDSRVFENKPRSPATPSIDGDVASLDATTKGRFIGRQRNGYGAAMGDIVLARSDSVPAQVRALLTQGLTRRGYRVVDAASGQAATLSVDIREFWAWFSPGMWAVSFEARLRSGLALQRRDAALQTVEVTGHGLNRGQVASDENWQLAYARAFEDFLRDLDKELGDAGW